MRSSLLAILAVSALLATPAAGEDHAMVTLSPEQIGEAFCMSRTGNDEGPIAGLLSPALVAAIADAEARNAAWAAANPGDKPPLGDGIPWQSWPDYAPDCSVGLVTLMTTDARVEIVHAFPDYPDGTFTDTLLLKAVDLEGFGHFVWRIDNLAFDTGGDLRSFLAGGFDDL